MTNPQLEHVQTQMEATVQALKAAADAQERQSLLRKMRRLIEEADRLVKDSLN